MSEVGMAFPAPGRCARCGRDPAIGFASINDDWFCHGTDEDWDAINVDPNRPTCYELAQRGADDEGLRALISRQWAKDWDSDEDTAYDLLDTAKIPPRRAEA